MCAFRAVLVVTCASLALSRRWAETQKSLPIRTTDAGLAQGLAEVVERVTAADEFSGVVLFSRHAKPLLRHASGFADREKRRANTAETPFALASVSKMFTAGAVAQLAERGRLSLSATLGSVLPGYPAGDGGAKVTVHHLRTPPGGEWHRAWDDPFAQQLRRMGVREQDAVRIEQKLQQRGIPVEVFNERFESRMNTVVPVLTALARLPLVPILRFFDRRRAWAEHFMFILSASNGVWLYSLLLLPLALVSVRFHQILIAFALYVYLGVVFFAHYRAATTLRTTGRFAVFAVADFVVSIVLSTVLFAIVYLSVLLF